MQWLTPPFLSSRYHDLNQTNNFFIPLTILYDYKRCLCHFRQDLLVCQEGKNKKNTIRQLCAVANSSVVLPVAVIIFTRRTISTIIVFTMHLTYTPQTILYDYKRSLCHFRQHLLVCQEL